MMEEKDITKRWEQEDEEQCYRRALMTGHFSIYYLRWPEGKYTEECYAQEALQSECPMEYLNRYPEGKYAEKFELMMAITQRLEFPSPYFNFLEASLAGIRHHDEQRLFRKCERARDSRPYRKYYPQGELIKYMPAYLVGESFIERQIGRIFKLIGIILLAIIIVPCMVYLFIKDIVNFINNRCIRMAYWLDRYMQPPS